MKPLFICVEGIDGSGTTTVSKLLVRRLNDVAVETVWSKEPSSGIVGRHIRRILKGEEHADEHAMFPMFLADRHDHICNLLRPELDSGNTVVCDRYAYSTWVYQQDNYDQFLIEFMQRRCLHPDYVFVLDCSVETAMERIGKREVVERYEIEEKQRVYAERYKNLVPLGSERIVVLDANQSDPECLVDLMMRRIGR